LIDVQSHQRRDAVRAPLFGRPKLAKLVMYSKQIGARDLIEQISDQVKPLIERIITQYAIDAIAYIPP
jgi:hypothetical protein